jgi:hypothetical protein
MASVTGYTGLVIKQHKVLLSLSWKPEVQGGSCALAPRGHYIGPLESPGRVHLQPFQPPEATCIPWLVAPPSAVRHPQTSPSDSGLLLLSQVDPCDLGPTPILKIVSLPQHPPFSHLFRVPRALGRTRVSTSLPQG